MGIKKPSEEGMKFCYVSNKKGGASDGLVLLPKSLLPYQFLSPVSSTGSVPGFPKKVWWPQPCQYPRPSMTIDFVVVNLHAILRNGGIVPTAAGGK